MSKRPEHESSDKFLFCQEMKDVIPLNAVEITDSKAPRPSPVVSCREMKLIADDHRQFPVGPGQAPCDTNDGSSYRKNGVRKKVMQKLKRGQFPITSELDLHHMRLEVAQTAILEFIAEAQGDGFKCVRIIHGKGMRSKNGPRLKLMTQQALVDHPQVLAFTPCKPANGGSGAVDVLLKNLC